MELEPLATGGAGALLVYTLLRIIGRWAARHRWRTTTSTEPVEEIARQRDMYKAQAEHEITKRVAAEAVASQCRAHMDAHHMGKHNANDDDK